MEDQTNKSELEKLLLTEKLNNPSFLKNGLYSIPVFNEKDLREAAHAEVANKSFDYNFDLDSKNLRSLNDEDKAKMSRNRNREHAKNTRLRKKAYITKLKEFLDQLIQQKEAELNEKNSLLVKIIENNTLKRNSVCRFFQFRELNQKDRAGWESVLDENVEIIFPITPYRYFNKYEIQGSFRRLIGIDAIINDTNSLNTFLMDLSLAASDGKVAFSRGIYFKINYIFSQDDIISVSANAGCRFMIKISRNTEDNHDSFIYSGMMHCTFNNEYKISSMVISFDVMSFMQQLQRYNGLNPDGCIVPNTLEMALLNSNEARAYLKCVEPYNVLHVNLNWTKVLGHTQSEIENRPLKDLFGLDEKAYSDLSKMAFESSAGKITSGIVPLTRKGKHLTHFKCYIKIIPLTSDSEKITHLLVSALDMTSALKD